MLLVAAGLRLVQLADQVIVFDEWHSLRAALSLGYGEIFTTFGEHSSIPLSLYFRAILDTVGIGAVAFRAPSLVAGLLLVALPFGVLPRKQALARATIAAIFALSPLLIYHSRFSRIYGVATLCALAALVTAWRWWEERRPGWGWAYVVFAAAAAFSTLAYIPFVLAPLAWSLGSIAFDRERRSFAPLRGWLVVATATAVLLALLLGPAWVQDAGTIEAKLGSAPGYSWGAILRYATGASGMIGVGWIAWSILGAAALWVRQRRLSCYLVLAAAALVGCVAILAPQRVGEGPVFARYMMPALLLGLASAGLGLVVAGNWLEARLPSARFGPLTPSIVICFAWLVIGAQASPLEALFVRPSAWANEMLALALDHPTVDPAKLIRREPAIYRELASRPPESTTIIEAPYTTFGLLSPFPNYQRRHRQRVLVASEAGACALDNTAPLPADPALDLPRVVYLADPDAVRQSGAELLIVHRMPMRELSYFREDNWYAKNFRMSGDDCVGYAERRFGPPTAADDDTVTFRLRPR